MRRLRRAVHERERPRRSFGAGTRGATAATRTFPLMDGAALMLAVASTVDRHGRVLTGPIEPDEVVADTDGGQSLDRQPAVAAARRWLDGLRARGEAIACTHLADSLVPVAAARLR